MCLTHGLLARAHYIDSIVIKAGMFSNQGWNAAAHQSGTLSGPARRLFFSYGKREWRDDVDDDGLPRMYKNTGVALCYIYIRWWHKKMCTQDISEIIRERRHRQIRRGPPIAFGNVSPPIPPTLAAAQQLGCFLPMQSDTYRSRCYTLE